MAGIDRWIGILGLSIGTVAVGLLWGGRKWARMERYLWRMRVSCGDDETRLESRFWHESFGPLFATCSGRYCAFFPLRSIFSCVRFLACVATLFHLALGLIFSWRALYFQQGFASSICWSWQRESSGAARIVPSFFLRSIVINFLPLLFIVATLSLCLVPFHLFF